MTRDMKQSALDEIWMTWSWLFYDKVKALDILVRHMSKDLRISGVPPDKWQPFLQERLAETIERCVWEADTEEANKRGQKKKQEPSSLEAIRRRKRAN